MFLLPRTEKCKGKQCAKFLENLDHLLTFPCNTIVLFCPLLFDLVGAVSCYLVLFSLLLFDLLDAVSCSVSAQDGITALGKVLTRFAPSLSSLLTPAQFSSDRAI